MELNFKNTIYSEKGGFLKGLGIFFLVIIIILAILIGSGYAYISYKLGGLNHIDFDKSLVAVNSGVAENLDGYRNIALFGLDTRDDSFNNSRSDSIIIVSINQETKDVNLTSIYRDTYVDIDGYGLDKITHAYAYGEPELALSTINRNLDLNITEFVTVNFETVKIVVDTLGGIELTLSGAEAEQIGLSSGGTYTLDGDQALAYARIRKIDSDYQRAERIRTVLDAVFSEVKAMGVSELLDFVDVVLPHISTNMSNNEIIAMAPSALSFNISESSGWPYDVQGYSSDAWYGVPVTLESNVSQLHEDLFGETNYTPSQTVQEISDDIINRTGYSG